MADDTDPRSLPDDVAERDPDEVHGAEGAVVVALDGSAADGPVTDWAADEAARLGVPLRLVTVVHPGVPLDPYDVVGSGSSVAQHLDGEAHRILERAVDRARARQVAVTDVATSVPPGPPAAALVRLSSNAARMVVGAPGRHRLERILLGSVALPVVAHAHCPVVVVPADTVVVAPRRILVGVDGSEASARALDVALTIGGASDATVTCVLCWNLEVHEGAVVTDRASEARAAVEQRYRALGQRTIEPVAERHPGVSIDVEVRHGRPGKALVEAAVELRADLVVVGSRGHGGFRGLLLGSVSRRVVERAPCVVAVVR